MVFEGVKKFKKSLTQILNQNQTPLEDTTPKKIQTQQIRNCRAKNLHSHDKLNEKFAHDLKKVYYKNV